VHGAVEGVEAVSLKVNGGEVLSGRLDSCFHVQSCFFYFSIDVPFAFVFFFLLMLSSMRGFFLFFTLFHQERFTCSCSFDFFFLMLLLLSGQLSRFFFALLHEPCLLFFLPLPLLLHSSSGCSSCFLCFLLSPLCFLFLFFRLSFLPDPGFFCLFLCPGCGSRCGLPFLFQRTLFRFGLFFLLLRCQLPGLLRCQSIGAHLLFQPACGALGQRLSAGFFLLSAHARRQVFVRRSVAGCCCFFVVRCGLALLLFVALALFGDFFGAPEPLGHERALFCSFGFARCEFFAFAGFRSGASVQALLPRDLQGFAL
jgi:hypothetical protein